MKNFLKFFALALAVVLSVGLFTVMALADLEEPTIKGINFDVPGYSVSFSKTTKEYTIKLPKGNPIIPNVSAVDDGFPFEVKQAVIPSGEKSGIAEIVVKNGDKTATYKVNMVKEAEKFVLQYGDSYTFVPDYALKSGEKFEFSTSDPAKASVDANGLVRAEKVTTDPVTITAKVGGTEKGKLVINEITKAQINLFFVTGQSNANGCYDLASNYGDQQYTAKQQLELVDRPEAAGQVYSYNAAVNSYSPVATLKPYKNDTIYDMYEHACNGFASALGKQYYALSGQKVIFCQTALNATAIEVWLKPTKDVKYLWSNNANLYEKTVAAYNDMIKKMGDNYVINHVYNFWLQGETAMSRAYNPAAKTYYDSGKGTLLTPQQYYDYFCQICADMKADFGVEKTGIILPRGTTGTCSAESVALGRLSDLNNIRASQYGLANNRDDIIMASRIGDISRMITNSDRSEGWGYTGLDNVHYNQIGYNAVGKDAATNMFRSDYDECEYVELIASDGRTRIRSGSEYTLKANETLQIGTMAMPETCGENVIFSSSDEKVATVDKFGLITGVGNGVATITATSESGKKAHIIVKCEVAKIENITYRWDFNGNINEANGLNNLTLSALSQANSATYTFVGDNTRISCTGANEKRPNFKLAKPITLTDKYDWTLEYRASFLGSSFLFGNESDAHNNIYNSCSTLSTNWFYPFVINKASGDVKIQHEGDDTYKNTYSKNLNTWRIAYTAADNKVTQYIYLDGEWKDLGSATLGTLDLTLTQMFGRFNDGGTVNFQGEMDYMQISFTEETKVQASPDYETVTYTWNFDTDLTEENGLNNLTMSPKSVKAGATYSIEGGKLVSANSDQALRPDFVFEKPITVTDKTDWSIEYKAKFNGGSILIGSDSTGDHHNIYNAFGTAAWNYPLKFNMDSGNRMITHADDVATYQGYNKNMNTWRVVYTAADNKLTQYIYLDSTWKNIGSVECGKFNVQFTSLLGRYNDAALVQFSGEMDYFKISFQQKKEQTLYDTTYRWNFNANLEEANGLNNLTLSEKAKAAGAVTEFSEDNTRLVSTNASDALRPDYKMEKPVRVTDKNNWMIEYRAKFVGGSLLIGGECDTHNNIYNAFYTSASGWDYPMVFNKASGDLKIKHLEDKTQYQAYNTAMNSWRLVYDAETQTLTQYILLDGTWTSLGSGNPGEFDVTFTNLFGRYTDAGLVQFKGEIDYMQISFDVDEDMTYGILEGENTEWIKGTTVDYYVKADAPFVRFKGVQIDGKDLANTDYSALEGSTIVKVKAALMQSLSEGDHVITLIFDNGKAETNFKVVKAPCLHKKTTVKNKKDATCSEEGYTGDTYCSSCNELIQKGEAIAKLPHNYVNGKCTVCQADDPDYKKDPVSPPTGSVSATAVWVVVMAVSACTLAVIPFAKKKD